MTSMPASLEAETIPRHNKEIAFAFSWETLQRQVDATHVEHRVITRPQTRHSITERQHEVDADSRLTEEQPAIHVDSLLSDAVRDFTDRIAANLEEDFEDAPATDGLVPSRGAVEACLRLAERVARHVVLSPS